MEVRGGSVTGEKGLFSTKNYPKDSVVYTLSGEQFDAPTRESIHIGNNKHIYDELGIFINHSFNPNIVVSGSNLVALEDIKDGDELMFNYNDTEMKMASPFYVNDKLVNGKSE